MPGEAACRAQPGAAARPEARIFSIVGQFALMQAVLAATGVVRNKVVASRLGPAGFGDLAQIALVATTLGSLVSLGMGVGLARNAARATTHAERQSQLATANAVVLSLSVVACAGCAVLLLSGALLPLVGLSPTPGKVIATILVVAAVPFEALRGNFYALLAGVLDVKGLATRRAVAVLVATALAVPIVWTLGFVGAALQLLILSVLVAVLLGSRCRALGYAPLAVRFDRKVATELVSFGVVSLAAGFSLSLCDTAVRTELIRGAGAVANAVFEAPWILAQTLKGIVLTSIGNVAIATVTSRRSQAENSQALEHLLTVVIPVAGSALGLLGLAGSHALGLLFSGAFSDGATLFPFLLTADVLMACAWVLGSPLLAFGDRVLWLSLELVFVGVRTAISLLLIPRLGSAALAIGYLGAVALHAILNFVVFRRRYHLAVGRVHALHVLLATSLVGALSTIGSRSRSPSVLAAGALAWIVYTIVYAGRTHLVAELRRRFRGTA